MATMKKSISILILLIATFFFQCGESDSSGVFRIQRGKFISSLTETGTLQAVNSTVIMMPFVKGRYERLKITYLEKEGTIVKKGQKVGEIDKTKIIQDLDKKKSDLAIAESDLEKLRVGHQTKIKQLQADLRSAESSLSSSKIAVERVQFESETLKKIKAYEFKKAEIAYDRSKKKIETTEIIQKEESKIQEIKIKQIKNEIELNEIALREFTLLAPKDGMIEYSRNYYTNKKVQVGDEMWPFWGIVSLPDLSRMKIETTVNEFDVKKISVGQKVYVRLDAFPKNVFEGRITRVSNISRKKERESKIKVFDVEVLLDRVDHTLKPGMTVSCEFITSEFDDVLFVEKSCIIEKDNVYYLKVSEGIKDKLVNVEVGPSNNRYIVVYGDIKEGDRIVITKESGEV